MLCIGKRYSAHWGVEKGENIIERFGGRGGVRSMRKERFNPCMRLLPAKRKAENFENRKGAGEP